MYIPCNIMIVAMCYVNLYWTKKPQKLSIYARSIFGSVLIYALSSPLSSTVKRQCHVVCHSNCRWVIKLHTWAWIFITMEEQVLKDDICLLCDSPPQLMCYDMLKSFSGLRIIHCCTILMVWVNNHTVTQDHIFVATIKAFSSWFDVTSKVRNGVWTKVVCN